MPIMKIDGSAQFAAASGTYGVAKSHLVSIGELARTLQYTSAEYDTMKRVVILQKDGLKSDPLPAGDIQSLMLIYRILWFEVQARHGGISEQLAGRLQKQDEQISALTKQVAQLSDQLRTGAAPTEPIPATALIPVDLNLHPPKTDEGNSEVDITLSHYRQQAIGIGGLVVVSGTQAFYSRPKTLGKKTAYNRRQKFDGLRYIFGIPDQLKDLGAFIGHDQGLVAERCLAG